MFTSLRHSRFFGRTGMQYMRLVATLPAFFGSVANARTELTVDAQLTAEEASNPFLINDDNTQSAAVALTVTPTWTLSEAAGTARFATTVRRTEFLRRYSSSDSVFAGGSSTWNASPRTQLKFDVSYSNSSSSDFDLLLQQPDQPLPDVTLNGFRSRQELFRSEAAITHQASATWSVGAGLFASAADINGIARANDYATYGGSANFSARLDAAGSVGASLSVLRYECRSQPACRSLVTQPQFTVSTELAPRWTLDVSAGVAINQLRLPLERRTTVSPAGSIRTCRNNPRDDLCVSLSQEISQTAISGTRPSLSISGSWQHRLSDRENVGLSFGYAGTTGGRLINEKYRYWNARMNGSSRIARNMSLTIDGGYLQNRSAISGRRSNVEVSMGIRFSLGKNM